MHADSKEFVEKLTLKKTLNKTKSLSLIIGSVLGSGLMILPGLAYKNVGIVSFYSWLAMGLFIIPFLYIFTQLTMKFPSAGGVVSVVHQVLGPQIGSSLSYMTLLAMIVLVPVVAVIGANYIGYLFMLTNKTIVLVAALMLILTTVINTFDTNLVLRIQSLSATILLLLLLLIIGVSSKLAMPQFFSQIKNVDLLSDRTYVSIVKGMVLVFWAFLGWENLSFTSEEFSDIKKDLPNAVIMSFLMMMFLYLGLSLSIIGILSPKSPKTVQAPLAEVIAQTVGNGYGKLVAIIGSLVMVINLNAWIWGPSRLLYDCGRKNILPKFLGRLSKYRTPLISLITLLIFYIIILSYMLINKSFILDTLIKIVNANFMMLYLLTIICFLKVSEKTVDLILGITSLILTISIMASYGYYTLIPILLLFIGYYENRLRRGFKIFRGGINT